MNVLADIIAKARTGRDLTDDRGTFHHASHVHTLANGETLCCFVASKAPNSRGARRGRHERIGFTYGGKEISRAKAESLLAQLGV